MKLRFPTILSALLVALALTAALAQTNVQPSVPLCPGLTVVTAISGNTGDYESIKTIESMDAKEVHLKYSAESMTFDPFSSDAPKLKQTNLHRTILTSDLTTGASYQQVYLEKSAETIPGTTAIGTSQAILRALKAGGEVEMKFSNAYGGLELTTDANKRPNYYDYLQSVKLKRVATVKVPVVVNDQPTQLTAIRAQGESVGDKVEFDFLDNENNPLTLAFRMGIGAVPPVTQDEARFCDEWRKHPEQPMPQLNLMSVHAGRCDMPNGGDLDTLRVIKINSRCNGPAAMLAGSAGGGGKMPDGNGTGAAESEGAKALEKALSQDKKVDIYSIYFSFNSDKLRDESQPTLKDIAEVMRRHPDWKLQVNGHTDAIGGDQFNLDLSKRRAAAVKNALVQQFKIGGDRFSTSGYGKSQPKDTNDTLEGRARNRRVELMKIG
ncbi:MAG TPA: OmpA family protein [Candidatus Sulfotelmatobacter sp.]|nr:OmpA family protein [Candidatus Sulfotelmatobacter sp.]